MKTFRWLAASAIALVPFTAASAEISAQRLSDVDKYISSDAFEGRGPATRAETKTIDYIAQQFKDIGLQPAGDVVNGQRGWFQTVPLLKSEWTAAPQMTLSLAGRPVTLTQGQEIAARSPTNGQKALDLGQVPLVFAGYGVKAPERGWDDFKGQDM